MDKRGSTNPRCEPSFHLVLKISHCFKNNLVHLLFILLNISNIFEYHFKFNKSYFKTIAIFGILFFFIKDDFKKCDHG